MDRILIHGTDLEVSQICFGQVKLGLRPDETEGMRLLDIFASLGGNFVDTASVYSDWVPGELHRSERILGDYFHSRGNRDQFVICTKGCHYDLATKADRVTPADFIADLESSLKALRTDRIDMYLFHRDDMRMPVAALLEVCEKAKAEGKSRYYGSSNWRVQRLTAADKAAQEHGFEASPFKYISQKSLSQFESQIGVSVKCFIESVHILLSRTGYISIAPFGSG